MRRRMTFVVMVAIIAPLSAYGESPATPSVADVQNLLDGHMAHRNAARWEQYVAIYTPEATVMSSAGKAWKGRDQALKGLQEDFAAGVYKGVQTKVTVESVQPIAPGVLVTDSTWELSNIPGGGTRKGRSVIVLVKSGDAWKIAAERSMVPVAAGAVKTN